MVSTTSRYYRVETARFTDSSGREIIHLRRRFVPSPNTMTVAREHHLIEGDRLDILSDRYFGDPTQFWQICDANYPMNPGDLTRKIGILIKIPLIGGG